MTESSTSAAQDAQMKLAAMSGQAAAAMTQALNVHSGAAASAVQALQASQAKAFEFMRDAYELQVGFAQKLSTAHSPTEAYQLMNDHMRNWSNLLSEQLKEASKIGQELSRSAMDQFGAANPK
jgi:Phasin protein